MKRLILLAALAAGKVMAADPADALRLIPS